MRLLADATLRFVLHAAGARLPVAGDVAHRLLRAALELFNLSLRPSGGLGRGRARAALVRFGDALGLALGVAGRAADLLLRASDDLLADTLRSLLGGSHG